MSALQSLGYALALVAIVATGCKDAPPASAPITKKAEAPDYATGGDTSRIHVRDARVSRPFGDGKVTAAYMVVRNATGTADRLSSASTPAAERTELHETVERDGMLRMIEAEEGYPLPGGADLELRPGGKHVMLIGLKKELAVGDRVALELRFESGHTIDLDLPVRGL